MFRIVGIMLQFYTGPLAGQNTRSRPNRPHPASAGQFPHAETRSFWRNGAIMRHFERDAIPYALETDWPLGAEGFEPLHLMRTHQDSPPRGRDSNLCISEFEFTETLSRGQDSNLRISMRKLVGSAALILVHRFESRG
jgi:hypothetical protein